MVDPRPGNAQRHDLLEILLIALAATLCGAGGCVDMALFGRAFRLLDPDAFEAAAASSPPLPSRWGGAEQVGAPGRPAAARSSRSTARPPGAASTASAVAGRSTW